MTVTIPKLLWLSYSLPCLSATNYTCVSQKCGCSQFERGSGNPYSSFFCMCYWAPVCVPLRCIHSLFLMLVVKGDHFFFTLYSALLWYNWHTVSCTYLKYAIWWLVTYVYTYETTVIIKDIQGDVHLHKSFLVSLCNSSLPSLPTPSPETTELFLSQQIYSDFLEF